MLMAMAGFFFSAEPSVGHLRQPTTGLPGAQRRISRQENGRFAGGPRGGRLGHSPECLTIGPEPDLFLAFAAAEFQDILAFPFLPESGAYYAEGKRGCKCVRNG